MNAVRYRILFIEDDKYVRLAFEKIVKKESLSYDFTMASSLSEAWENLKKQKFDVVVTDYFLGDGNAFEIFPFIKNTPIIFVTGFGDEETAVKALKEGAFDYIIKDGAGNFLKMLPVAIDRAIEKKKADERFRMLSHALTNVRDSVFVADFSGDIIFVNRAFCEMYECDESEAMGKNSLEFIMGRESSGLAFVHGNFSGDAESFLAMVSSNDHKNDIFIRRKDGSELPISLSISNISDERGNMIASVGIASDISVQVKTEIELRQSREFLKGAVDSLSTHVAILNERGMIIHVNSAWLNFSKMCGFDGDKYSVGMDYLEMCDDEAFGGDADSAVIVDGIRSVMNMQAESFTHEYLLEMSGGQCWFLMKVNLFKGNGPLRVIISNENITPRKLAEDEMKKARNMAEEASRAKSDFIAGMSHEIRNPMNSIIGMADMLSNTALTDEQRKYVQLLHTASETLLDLINDVLDLSKIESGHLSLEEINFNLLDLVEKACDVMAIRAHQKNIELYYRIDPDIKISVTGDPLRLRQVLFNLVGNAIKFTESGHIVLNIEKDGSSSDDNALIFSVSDTGIGIEKEKLPLLFQKYSQADSAVARKYGGTGLGLAISKNLVEMMGGDIRVKSRPGHGSTFYFNLRIKAAPHSRKLSEVFNMDLEGLKILIIDENRVGAAILSETLSRCKASVKSIATIDEAVLELAVAKESGRPYDITFVDSRISLYEKERERAYKNFGEAAWYIKEKQQLTREVIMMLTTKRMASDIEYCREKKISAYIVKPFKHSELFEAISGAVGGLGIAVRNISVSQKNITGRLAGEKIKILLVEDSDTNRLLAQTYLKDMNFDIDTAENGKIAVDMAMTSRYDLILMDMNMPVMDGRAATGFIRGYEKENGILPVKIIALTADVFKEDIDRSINSGCDAYLTKPIKKSKLIETIIDHLSGDPGRSEKN